MKSIKSATTIDLSSLISRVVTESMKSALAQKALTEKEKQDAVASNFSDKKSSDADESLFDEDADEDAEESSSSKTIDDETEKLKKGNIEPKDIVEKLNAIRSGKSFKDSTVANSMEEYINSLSKAERVALMAFLKGISQIVTGQVPAKSIPDPSAPPSDVQMQKGQEKQIKHIEPNVLKSKKPAEQKSGSDIEDTSAPAPIKAKRR